MRHGLAVLLVTAVAAATAGCSGADAQEAQLLLEQSNAAFAQVRSATFTARLTMTGGPQELDMTMTGGGYAKGRHAGEFYVVATSDTLPFRELTAVSRSGRVWMTVDGTWLGNVPVSQQSDNPIQLVDIQQYVKDVTVDHGTLIDGQSMAKISGVIDTAGLADGALADLTGAGGSGIDLSKALGDTRIVLYVSESTHLPMRGLVDVPIEVAGEKIEMHLDFAYTSYDKRIDFP
jgi:hypothetical protein